MDVGADLYMYDVVVKKFPFAISFPDEFLSSYLSSRSYCVVVDGVSSKVTYIICSMPRGSVLRPVLFILWQI